MKSILLVTPAFDHKYIFEDRPHRKNRRMAFMAPVSCATVAALTPDHFQVDLWDENIHGEINAETPLPKQYDLVGITGFSIHYGRVKALSELFRSRGALVVLGGPAASTTPERYLGLGDVIFIGEVEYTWPAFLQDWEKGTHRSLYRQIIKPELSVSPVPRWDLVGKDMNRYFVGAVQTSRGCPYDCDFCDVPYVFGHRSRWKPVPDVLKEIEMQQKLGVRRIFFCDDNFIGDMKYARSLLTELARLNNTFPVPISFFTQLTLNVGRKDDLLELMADANFSGLFIGIETPNKESLKGAKKVQNVYTDIVADVHKIQSYGMTLWSGIIVGFDFDTRDIFDQQFDFLQEACVTLPQIQLLYGPPGTQLGYRLQKEGRLLVSEEQPTLPHTTTNIVPKKMSRVELFRGHLALHERLREWDHFSARMKGLISGVRRQPNIPFLKERSATRQRQEKRWRIWTKVLRSPIGNALLGTLAAAAKLVPGFPHLGSMLLEKKARNVILDIIDHSLKEAPWMFPERILAVVIMETRHLQMLRGAKPAMLKQIELESAPDFRPEYAESAFYIPEVFAEAYKQLFPVVYSRVSAELVNKGRCQEVLIDVFTDFLSRWDGRLDRIGPQHQADLEKTCATFIARENLGEHTGLVSLGPPVAADFRINKLPDEILHSVEQELRMRPAAMTAGSPL